MVDEGFPGSKDPRKRVVLARKEIKRIGVIAGIALLARPSRLSKMPRMR